jgi:hypothetical protein
MERVSMESAVELHQARILRGQIEALQTRLETEGAENAAGVEGIQSEFVRLRDELRRVLALRADVDYQRRRALWRLEARSLARRSGSRACA